MLTYKEPGNIESKILAPFLLVCFGLFWVWFFLNSPGNYSHDLFCVVQQKHFGSV